MSERSHLRYKELLGGVMELWVQGVDTQNCRVENWGDELLQWEIIWSKQGA
jgi:hypothetical protein